MHWVQKTCSINFLNYPELAKRSKGTRGRARSKEKQAPLSRSVCGTNALEQPPRVHWCPPTPQNCLTDGTGIVFLSGSCPGYTCVRCLQADRKGLESCTSPTTASLQDWVFLCHARALLLSSAPPNLQEHPTLRTLGVLISKAV